MPKLIGRERCENTMDSSTPHVSIVMPVYNAERYLDECLAGVRAQTLTNIEIVCVDDGSTDSSPQILARHAAKDARIRVISGPNQGYGAAMNKGIAAATGTYVGVVEPDDLVDPEMFATLWQAAEEAQADVVKGDFYDFCDTSEGRKETYRQICPTTLMYGPVLDATTNASLLFCVMMTWEGIYRRQFLESIDVRHNETPGASFQDNGFWWQVFTQAKRVVFVNEAHYRYRVGHAGSSNVSPESALRIADEYAFVRAWLDSVGRWGRYAHVFSYFYFDNLIARAAAVERDGLPEYAAFVGREWQAYLRRGEADRTLLPDFLADQLDAVVADPANYDPSAWPSIATVSWDEVESRRGETEIRRKSVSPYSIVSQWEDCIVGAADAGETPLVDDTPESSPSATELLGSLLEGHDVLEYGVIANGEDEPLILHDRQGAPFVATNSGMEDRSMLVSDTDELDERLLAWVRVPKNSDVVGVGIDISLTEGLECDRRGNHFARLLLTTGERMIVNMTPGPVPLLRAQVFAAKEAAFKSVSVAVRRQIEMHERLPKFGVRDFQLYSDGTMRGTARKWSAERAIRQMGIKSIRVAFGTYKGMALCVAVALADKQA